MVPHKDQRYNTVGDWIPGDPIEIRVSRMSDRRHELLIAIHEFVEYGLCKIVRISDERAMNFDKNYRGSFAEPGDDRRSPYHGPHAVANWIENIAGRLFRVKESEYEKDIERVYSSWKEGKQILRK